MVLVEQRVDVVGRGQLELLEQVEQAPDADAVAVVAPGVIALLLRLALLRGVPAGALAIGVDLDVGGHAERQALAAGPGIVLALADAGVALAFVLGERQIKGCRPAVTAGPEKVELPIRTCAKARDLERIPIGSDRGAL